MKPLPIPPLLRLLFLSTLVWYGSCAQAFAESVIIKSFRAPVDVQRADVPDRWSPARVGLELKAGDVLRTGARARAELKMADGSRMALGPNSRLKIDNPALKERVFGLDAGRLKSFIKKLKGGSKFQIKTPLAAASVRGTVFEIGFDESTQQGFLDVFDGTVALLKGDREVLVPQGKRLDFLPDTPLGEPVPRKAEATEGARAETRREVGLSMSKEEVMAAAAEEMRLAEYQEGKTLVDVNGVRVRLQEYVIRRPREVDAADQDKSFKLVVLNERDDRFDYFYYRGLFNKTLPTDLSTALKDINGKLGATAPDYYLTAYEMGQSNTVDTIKDSASGGHLVKVEYNGTNFTLTDPSNPANTKTFLEDRPEVVDGVTYHRIYDPVGDRTVSVSAGDYTSGNFRPAVYDPDTDTFRNITSGDTYWRTRYNSYSHALDSVTKQSYTAKNPLFNTLTIATARSNDDFSSDAVYTYAGGTLFSVTETPSGEDKLHNRVTLYYGDGTQEKYDTYIISDEGKIGPTSAFSSVTSGGAYKTELLKWNYQQIATATEFSGRKIDLVVEPKILIKSGLIK